MNRRASADEQAPSARFSCDEWARAGVTEAVIAPGSRSTPLVVALASEHRIRLHVVLDESSAGFVALGLGLATGRPAVVVTTSGTASVELHPSVVEASLAGVPMIAATADRPAEFHDVGAAQTVEQRGLFGGAVRWSVEGGIAVAGAAASWRSLASRTVAEALAGPKGPGPVHLNLPFREPLLGATDRFTTDQGRNGGRTWHSVTPVRTSGSAVWPIGWRRSRVAGGSSWPARARSSQATMMGSRGEACSRPRERWDGRCWPIHDRGAGSSTPEWFLRPMRCCGYRTWRHGPPRS